MRTSGADVALVQRWQLARHRQWTLIGTLMASTHVHSQSIVRLVVDMEHIAVLHDANKDWIRAQTVMGLSLHVHAQGAARSHSSLCCLYPEECA
jgi:hypothetical protein